MQRVISTGLKSIKGGNSVEIVTMFEAMAVSLVPSLHFAPPCLLLFLRACQIFAEDAVIPLRVISVLWASIFESEASVMKLRQCVGRLLQISLLLGESASFGAIPTTLMAIMCVMQRVTFQRSSHAR